MIEVLFLIIGYRLLLLRKYGSYGRKNFFRLCIVCVNFYKLYFLKVKKIDKLNYLINML